MVCKVGFICGFVMVYVNVYGFVLLFLFENKYLNIRDILFFIWRFIGYFKYCKDKCYRYMLNVDIYFFI